MRSSLNCIIMGAAGRDFHDFQTFFRGRKGFCVRAFTAAQIPFIETRSFPREMAGADYAEDIPIYSESRLPELIEQLEIDFVFLAYSDLPHGEVMHKASLVQSCGASFALLGPRQTQLKSQKPVIAVTAVRTGAGKSPIAQMLASRLTDAGRRVGVLRHPMPYGDLKRQQVERFASYEDLDRYRCTVEEREEYEPYIDLGLTIFAGVDYQQILSLAESESDVILWDGGNNDFAFIRPDLSIVVLDALRAGHETSYYPGETNLRSADIIVINKAGDASDAVKNEIALRSRRLNPKAEYIFSALEIEADRPQAIQNRKVLVIEDGPTLTHGGMSYGAGVIAAKKYGAAELIDPRPFAVGSIAEIYEKFTHLENVLPALGYSPEQCRELEQTIANCQAELVIDASPARIDRVLQVEIPIVRIHYRFQQLSGPPLEELVNDFLESY